MFQNIQRKNFKEFFLHIYIYLFLVASIITAFTSYLSELYIDSFFTFISFIVNIAILYYYQKSNNFKLSALLWLWNASAIIFFGIIYNEFSIEVLYLPLIPLGASLILTGRTLMFHGSLFLLSIVVIFIYGYIVHPENPFLHDIKLLGNFTVLVLLILTFGVIYQYYIEKSYRELEKSHQEKAILLQEVHHRVKNNLNMMSSILGLQDNGDEKTSQLIESNRRRLESIAMVHEFLYNNKNFKEISFKEYTQKLSQHLVQAISPFNIPVKIDAPNIYLCLDTMASLGLILQEMITNSLKYAQFEKGKSEINIELKKEEELYLLHYCDSGTSNTNNESSDSLGLKLIALKIDELDGELQIETTNGYNYKIRFPHEKL